MDIVEIFCMYGTHKGGAYTWEGMWVNITVHLSSEPGTTPTLLHQIT